MNRIPLIVFAIFILTGPGALGQDVSGYRAYRLNSTLGAVAQTSGTPASATKTLHQRPAVIQLLEWRAPYIGSTSPGADPVRDIAFSFYNDALYQVTVNYERGRTAELTDADIIESVSTAYGMPSLAQVPKHDAATQPPPDNRVIAQWERADAWVTLTRGLYSSDVQLLVASKALSGAAATAIREAQRLDATEAPRLEAEQRRKDAGDASDAREKTRAANKEAFRP